MATPLTALSKYTGVFMAVLCALLMFSFVIADPLMQYAGGGGGGASRAGEVVATWQGGQINQLQLDQAVLHRRVLSAFQQAVYRKGTQDAIAAEAGDLPLRVNPLELRSTMEQGVERDVVQKKIFAQRAQQAGMVVSDEMIVDYLRAIGRDRVSNEDMRRILSQMQLGGGQRATISFMFDLLRDEMLAQNYLVSHAYAFETVLPAERWEDWRMLNDRLSVEAAPVTAASFVEEVAEPTEEELNEYFDKYKGDIPSSLILRQWGGIELPSPTPGFATPNKVSITYLEGNFDRVVDKLAEGVTQEAIEQYYNDNLEQFVEADRALFGDDSLFGDEDSLESDEPSTEEPAEEEEATEEAAAEAAEDTTEEAVEEEEEEEEEPDTPTTTSVSYRPLEEVQDDIRTAIASTRAAETLQGLMDSLKTELNDSYVEYFNKVLDAEDAESAAPAPPEKLTNLKPMAEANGLDLVEIDDISQAELRESTIGGSGNADPNAARRLPLWFLAFRQSDLDTYQPIVTFDLDGNRYLVLVTKRTEGFTPKLEDVRDQVVAAWKREKAAEKALEKAKEIASAASDSGQSLREYLAAQTDSAVAADAVFETEPFSFLTIGNIAPTAREVPLRLSQPEPLVAPGPDLLEAVFDLEADGAGAQWNHDHSIAYVLRVAQRQRSTDELRQQFLNNGERWLGAQTLLSSRVRRAAGALVLDLLDSAELDWKRAPDQPF